MGQTLSPEKLTPYSLDILPPFISPDQSQGLLVEEEMIHEGSSGPYVQIANYGTSLESLKSPTGYKQKSELVTYLAGQDKVVRQASKNITSLVELGYRLDSFSDKPFSLIYASNFILTIIPSLEAAISDSGQDWTLIAPWRGGEIVQQVIGARGYNPNMPLIRESRVILKDGGYLIGISVEQNNPVVITDSIVFADDCRAAAGSEDAALRWAIEQNPGVKSIASAVAIGVKKSGDIISQTWNNKDGISYVSYAGDSANGMNDDYYLVVTDEEKKRNVYPKECQYRVGDMGEVLSLRDGRQEFMLPLINAVAEEKIDSDFIFTVTKQALMTKDPKGLDWLGQSLLDKTT
jgi:hypothetical protein